MHASFTSSVLSLRRRMATGTLATLLLFATSSSFLLTTRASPPQGNSTTLSATKTATGHLLQVYDWTIDKSVTPGTLDLFTGDSGTVQYTVSLTKTPGLQTASVSGEICVTNNGSFPTENLAIVDEVQYKIGSGPFLLLTSLSVDMSAAPILNPGETHCYPYQITIIPVSGATYRNVAHVTITNHAGWLPGSNNCPGLIPCPFGPDPKANFSLPSTPDIEVNGTVNVNDTNGQSWPFSASGSQTYSKIFSCDADQGAHGNIATIVETGQSDNASVQVNCYSLTVKKTAETSLDRLYRWSIVKLVDQTALTLGLNQTQLLNYLVTVTMTGSIDSNWGVTGTITIHNPAPMAATLTSVQDLIDGTISSPVTCPSLTVLAGGDLVCIYTSLLPNGSLHINEATATLQNIPQGTTNFSVTLPFDFSNALINAIDETVAVSDSLQGFLGNLTAGVDILPKTYAYTRTAGPYAVCGNQTINNTASFTTNDTQTGGNSSQLVTIEVPCAPMCVSTIGYWKNHAGFGPQADALTPLLPIWLGTPSGLKSVNVTTAAQAVQLLKMNGLASNGINKLYAQLLGAKLNIANGANATTITSTIAAADAFLATKNSADWNTLTATQKAQVLQWMTILDNYNNGLIGPPHCG